MSPVNDCNVIGSKSLVFFDFTVGVVFPVAVVAAADCAVVALLFCALPPLPFAPFAKEAFFPSSSSSNSSFSSSSSSSPLFTVSALALKAANPLVVAPRSFQQKLNDDFCFLAKEVVVLVANVAFFEEEEDDNDKNDASLPFFPAKGANGLRSNFPPPSPLVVADIVLLALLPPLSPLVVVANAAALERRRRDDKAPLDSEKSIIDDAAFRLIVCFMRVREMTNDTKIGKREKWRKRAIIIFDHLSRRCRYCSSSSSSSSRDDDDDSDDEDLRTRTTTTTTR
jgi:hypothetical protein